MYTERQHIRYLYILVAILFFCVAWIAALNIRDMQIWIDNNKLGITNTNDRIDKRVEEEIVPRLNLLSEVGEQNAKWRIPVVY